MAYTNNTLVENNDISRPSRLAPSDFTGIYVVNQNLNARISKNRIHDPYAGDLADASIAYGIYFSSCDATAGNENIVSNNVIYNFNGGGAHHGLYNSSSDSVRYLHNTIALNDVNYTGSAVARGFTQLTTARGIELTNNIFSITRTGTGAKHALYFGATTTASTITSNRNDLFITPFSANHFTGYLAVPTPAASFSSIADWRTATGQDINSVVLRPLFTNETAGNLLPQTVELDNLGAPAGITTDILNNARSAGTPDLGAYEFTGAIVLPVKIVNLYAGQLKNDVIVNWNTSMELNAAHYEIERSLNGVDFIYAGRVVAANQPNGAAYRFQDANAVLTTAAKTIYYRIRMVDINGSYAYSTVAVAKIGKGMNFIAEAHPNPFTDKIVLKLSAVKAQQVDIKLLDKSGRLIFTTNRYIPAGLSLATLTEHVSKLAAGTYILTLQTTDGISSLQVLKQ
ncbi:MAG: T9SS type A sorting domain-containing protein [Chitinophagaceae bacterium]|nr:MAG: T9SS type A sorting domain-containing protein [Chitinophagaceae bacterium]